MKKSLLSLTVFFICSFAYAQREKGKILKTPKIFQKESSSVNQNESTTTQITLEAPNDFQFEEQPRLRFSSSFETKSTKAENLKSDLKLSKDSNGDNLPFRLEPIRDVNTFVQDDTSSIDEGELQIVEIEDMVAFNDPSEMVKVASYYSVWDTKNIDPYGINPNDFEDVIPIKLYDLNEGRYWNSPLIRTPLTSHFGWRGGRWHRGTDIDLETGDPVYTVFDGIVRVAGWHSGWGNTILIRHYNGLETLYGHLSKIMVEPNTLVKAGDKLGLGGNTGRSSGSHLHFEVRYEGNAFDSENVFRYSGSPNGTEIIAQDFMLEPQLYDYLRGGKSKVVFDMEEEEEDAPILTTQYVWYKVKKGDTLSKIAERNGMTLDQLCELNKIRSNQRIYVNLRLRLQ